MLHDPAAEPFSDVNHLGLAITEHEAGGRHCGIIYRLDDGGAMLVHLGWHMELGHEPPHDRYAWIDIPQLDDAERKLLAVLANRIGTNGSDMPYAFAYPAGIKFSPDGFLEGSRVGRGFTCATFVLAVFSEHGFELADSPTWPENANDAWQLGMLDIMRARGVHAQHVLALEAQVGVRRIRPEEVISCAEEDSWPVSYDDAQNAAIAIVSELQAILAARPVN